MCPAKALSPKELEKFRKDSIPDIVMETFNQMLADCYGTGYVIIHDKDIVAALVKKGLDRSEIYRKGWLGLARDMYRKQGWNVYYDAPGYCESYDAYTRFSSK
tara:strand:+ start:3692 stop:4000 length:309 start_codon:yes stop_codon:yes gene_type:complete